GHDGLFSVLVSDPECISRGRPEDFSGRPLLRSGYAAALCLPPACQEMAEGVLDYAGYVRLLRAVEPDDRRSFHQAVFLLSRALYRGGESRYDCPRGNYPVAQNDERT